MKFYSGMPNEEFVQELRDAAIRNHAPPLMIAAIDKLADSHDQRELIDELESEIESLRDEVKELQEEISKLEK